MLSDNSSQDTREGTPKVCRRGDSEGKNVTAANKLLVIFNYHRPENLVAGVIALMDLFFSLSFSPLTVSYDNNELV